MPQYRIYRLNAAGHIVTGSDVSCGTDEAAFTWAATRLGSDARAEIWESTRLVGQICDRMIHPHASEVPAGPIVEAGQAGPGLLSH